MIDPELLQYENQPERFSEEVRAWSERRRFAACVVRGKTGVSEGCQLSDGSAEDETRHGNLQSRAGLGYRDHHQELRGSEVRRRRVADDSCAQEIGRASCR